MPKANMDIIFNAGEGVVLGAGVDQLLYGLSAYVPQLQQSAGFVIPGYASGGIHIDDLIALGISGAVTVIGALSKKPSVAVKGIGMFLGNYISSQFQITLPKPIGTAGAGGSPPQMSQGAFGGTGGTGPDYQFIPTNGTFTNPSGFRLTY